MKFAPDESMPLEATAVEGREKKKRGSSRRRRGREEDMGNKSFFALDFSFPFFGGEIKGLGVNRVKVSCSFSSVLCGGKRGGKEKRKIASLGNFLLFLATTQQRGRGGKENRNYFVCLWDTPCVSPKIKRWLYFYFTFWKLKKIVKSCHGFPHSRAFSRLYFLKKLFFLKSPACGVKAAECEGRSLHEKWIPLLLPFWSQFAWHELLFFFFFFQPIMQSSSVAFVICERVNSSRRGKVLNSLDSKEENFQGWVWWHGNILEKCFLRPMIESSY